MSDLLKGVRIIDLTNNVAGPMATYQLSQLGADVIKVEMPATGDPARKNGGDPELNKAGMGIAFLAHGGGKRSLTLDLKSGEGRAVFHRLLDTADVVVASFRPGVMARLDLDYERLKARKADIVYCALSGFGADGPLSGTRAYDQIIQGLSGLMSITGDENSAPLRVGFPVSDAITGLTAAFAISAALFRKERTKEGEFIDISMLESTLVAMGWVILNTLVAGLKPEPMGNENIFASPSGTFVTGSGSINIAAHTQKQFVALCGLIGRADLAEDPRFAVNDQRKVHRRALKDEIEAALAARPAAAWAELFNEHGVPAGEVLSVEHALSQPQIAGRNLVHSFDNPPGVGMPLKVLRSGFRLASGDPGPSRPPPPLGADTDAILADLGYSPAEIARLRAAGTV
jgi:CoA:oxalate CoA-transferase